MRFIKLLIIFIRRIPFKKLCWPN